MKFILLLFALFISNIGFMQEEFFDISGNITSKVCKYDSSTFIMTLDNYDVYQTEDGEIDGIRLEQCISWERSSNNTTSDLQLDQINLSLPLFISIRDTSSLLNAPLPLDVEPNTLYNFILSLDASAPIFDIPSGCTTDWCSETIIEMEVPSFSGDSTVVRERAYIYDGNERTYFRNGICITTPNLVSPTIKRIVSKVVFNTNALSVDFIQLRRSSLFKPFNQDLILQDITLNDPQINQNKVEVSDQNVFGDFANRIVVHTNGYPGEQNKDVKLIKIFPNPSEQVEINFRFFQPIIFQQYTSFDTELVAGMDSTQHILNLILFGGQFCLDLVDVVINNGGSFRFTKGEINLQCPTSCLNFKNESTFIVTKEKKLTYGNYGEGVLGLTNGKVLLEEGAELIVDSDILLDSRNGKNSRIDLKSGARIQFSEGVDFIINGHLDEQLEVYAYRSQVDLSALSEESRNRILIIEPKSSNWKVLDIYPNPTDGIIYFKNGINDVPFRILSLDGKLLEQGEIDNSRIELPFLNKGLYLLKIGGQSQTFLIN